MRLNVVHTTELDRWIADRHYLHTAPAGAVIRMEIMDDEGSRIGGMMWGKESQPKAGSAGCSMSHPHVLCG